MAEPIAAKHIDALKDLLGAGNFLDESDDMTAYVMPWRGEAKGHSPLIAQPTSVEQLQELVRYCAKHSIAMVPQGGNTGLVYGAMPQGEIVVSLSRLRAIRRVDLTDNAICVEAGVLLAEVQERAKADDRIFPLSMASEGSAQIGGVAATNAGGTAVIKYGNMRDLVLGLEVVLPNGDLICQLSPLPKDNAGFDVKQLFIGSEGCLGFITALTLKLFPAPKSTSTSMLAVGSTQAASETYKHLKQSLGESIVAFEMISSNAMQVVNEQIDDHHNPFDGSHAYYLLVEVESTLADYPLRTAFENALASLFESGQVEDAIIAESSEQARKLWSIREHVSEAARKSGKGLHYDIAVPSSQIGYFIEQTNPLVADAYPNVRTIDFGHYGDGNIHYNQYFPNDIDASTLPAIRDTLDKIIYDQCLSLGGTISAEHGVGLDRQKPFYDYNSDASIALMRSVKAAIDPQNLMNPGKVLHSKSA
ncbi:MAG: FAD-binding oxidoreductase [Rickettsiales bacterium]|nr:FAD-binding oxidoreductase [Rickettsiales bacterium]